MILYKYRTNCANTTKIFSEKKVWLSNAENLNDPFECSIQEIAKEWIDENVRQLKEGHIAGFIHSAVISMVKKDFFYDLDSKQTKEFLKKFKKKNFDEQYKTTREFIKRKTGREISDPNQTYANFDKQLNEVGIFSMSETCENQLMWSHYGDKFKGVAIGFESYDGSKLSLDEYCLKVNYSDSLPAFNKNGFLVETSFYVQGQNVQKIAFKDPTLKEAISTKPVCWEYEREWRYVEEISGAYNFPGKLKEIVFGLKCPIETRQEYVDLIKSEFNDEVEYYEIISIDNTNQIKKKRIN